MKIREKKNNHTVAKTADCEASPSSAVDQELSAAINLTTLAPLAPDATGW